MIYQYIKPSQKLEPFIKHYWVLEESKPISKHCKTRIYPSGYTDLILYYGDRYLCFNRDNSSIVQPSFHFAGQNTNYYDLSPTGKIGLIAITFKPDSAKLFFKIPVYEAENNFVALEDILGKSIKNLEYKLQTAANNVERIKIIESFLLMQLKDLDTDGYKRVNYSIQKINQKKGLVSVEALAGYACLSTKQFNRIFSDFVGVNPKQFTRVVRFQHAIYNKQVSPVRNLTELAYKCGYYDQAHFTNEFRSFTGYTPKEFFNLCEPYSDYFS